MSASPSLTPPVLTGRLPWFPVSPQGTSFSSGFVSLSGIGNQEDRVPDPGDSEPFCTTRMSPLASRGEVFFYRKDWLGRSHAVLHLC